MELDEILKLNNTIVSVKEMEEIIESEYFTWYEREIGDETYEGYVCYTITLYVPLSDFENPTIKVYIKG